MSTGNERPNYRFGDDHCEYKHSGGWMYAGPDNHIWVKDSVEGRKVCCLCGLVRPADPEQ